VSRRHAAVRRDTDGCVYLMDLGSVHGTWFAGQRLEANQPVRLFDGVSFRLGESAREYATEGVPLMPVAPAPAPRVMGAAPRPNAGAQGGTDAAPDPSGNDLELDHEVMGLPAAFGRPGQQPAPTAAPPASNAAARRRRKKAVLKIQDNVGAGLGIVPGAPAEERAVDEGANGEARGDLPAGEARNGAQATQGLAQRPADAGTGLGDGPEGSGDEELIGPPGPSGMAVNGNGNESDDDDDFIGPPMPPGAGPGPGSDDEYDDESQGGDAEEAMDPAERWRAQLPLSHQVAIAGHGKTVTVVSVDHAGARMVTGSSDYGLRLYDFNGMAADLKPFRILEEPMGSYQIRSVDWSPTSSNFIVGASSPQPRVYDRDGKEVCDFMRGDMYIRDLRHTKGHVAAVTCVRWHPTEALEVATASEDSTVRTWDVEVASQRKDRVSLNPNSGQKRAFAVKSERGQRLAVTAFDWHVDGKTIALVATDGSLQLWDTRHHDTRPQLVARGAHEDGTETSSVRWAPRLAGAASEHLLATRGGGGDDTMKLWDVRIFREASRAGLGTREVAAQPVAAWSDLPALGSRTPCEWGVAGTVLLTGTSAVRGAKARDAELVAVSVHHPGAPPVRSALGVNASVGGLCWHPRLNQVFVGGSDGVTYALYDPARSERGVLLCKSRAPKRRDVEMGDVDRLQASQAVAPHALPLFKEGPQKSRKRGRDRERERELETRKPLQLPPKRPSEGFQHALIKTVDKNLNAFRDEDPREAILRYAEIAEEDPLWTGAYAETQPKPVLAKSVNPEDDEKDLLPQ